MNKVLNTLIALVIGAAAMPAVAGPDFAAIEQARKAGQVMQTAAAENVAVAIAGRECPPRLVLPLDHGPRAVTTPYLNEQRNARHEARKHACGEMRQADPSAAERTAG